MTVYKSNLQNWLKKRKWLWPIVGFLALLITPFFWLYVMVVENHDDFFDMVNECLDVMFMRVDDDE